MEVTLMQMLAAREERVARQNTLLHAFGKSIVSFSMNIPGPEKDSPLIRRGFWDGCRALEEKIPPVKILHREVRTAITGCEALYVVDCDGLALKSVTTSIEDTHGLGRLYDMDVIGPDRVKLDREIVGGKSRDCIVCGAKGRGCASRRTHSVVQLQQAAHRIFREHYAASDAFDIGRLAVQCLMEEVHTTPKPGLVDCRNSGSHTDMGVSTFLASANALGAYFRKCAQAGMDTAGKTPRETFLLLRKLGEQAEKDMYAATGGVNTHKGAIFTLGVLCGAAGRCWEPDRAWEEETLFREVAAMTRETMEEDWIRGGNTVGHRLYREYGIRGIRGEVSDGLPSVEKIGLPVFRDCLARGMDRNFAGVHTLLHLIARVADTNMIARGGIEGLEAGREAVRKVLERGVTREAAEELDDWFILQNLSPGGCADLLAAVYFTDYLFQMRKSRTENVQ